MTGTANKTLFSITDLAIKAPTDAHGVWVDVPYVVSATFKGSHQSVDVFGDDALQDVLCHTQRGTITVKASRAATAVLEKVTGTSSSVSGSYDLIDMMRLSEVQTPVVLAVRAQTRAIATTAGTATIYWYKTRCAATFEEFLDMGTGKICDLTLTFDVFMSAYNEDNVALANNAFGRIEIPTAA
jgi:hypothetical protein